MLFNLRRIKVQYQLLHVTNDVHWHLLGMQYILPSINPFVSATLKGLNVVSLDLSFSSRYSSFYSFGLLKKLENQLLFDKGELIFLLHSFTKTESDLFNKNENEILIYLMKSEPHFRYLQSRKTPTGIIKDRLIGQVSNLDCVQIPEV